MMKTFIPVNVLEFDLVDKIIGSDRAQELAQAALKIYKKASEYAASKGVIIADTKFEFGLTAQGELVLADEVLTPDSSRFWPADQYQVGQSQPR